MRIAWLSDGPEARSGVVGAWAVATALATRGHVVSWIDVHRRATAVTTAGVRLCPFPYQEQEWLPGQALRHGLDRLLRREIPADVVVVLADEDRALVAADVVGARGSVLWWPAGQRGLGMVRPVPAELALAHPMPTRGVTPTATSGAPAYLTAGAFGGPTVTGVGNLLPCLLAHPETRLLTMPGRDPWWSLIATATGAGGSSGAALVPLWNDGFDEKAFWHTIHHSWGYVSLAAGFDPVAAAALAAGVPVYVPESSALLGARRYTDANTLAALLASAHPRQSSCAPSDDLRTIGDDWEHALVVATHGIQERACT